MYIYNNTCSVNNDCGSGYSLYFPCVSTITRGENSCSEFYIVDNATKQESDLREVDDITLNISGRYNCNFGSYSYPENIKSLQVEKFSEFVYNVDFTNVISEVKLYIDVVDENHQLIESFLFDKNSLLDIAIEGSIGFFLNNSDKFGVLNLKGYDTKTYMFLGWNIDESDDVCDLENIYDFLIKKKKLSYNIFDNCVVRAVYQKRREYTIQMADDNYNSSFVVEYMGEKTILVKGDSITALEGHDVKITCIPFDLRPYVFEKWDDGYDKPFRVLNINGNDLVISLKAHCKLNINDKNYIDNIDASLLKNFKTIYPYIQESFYIDDYYINNLYINNCEMDVLNNVPYVKIIGNGYIQIININTIGNLKLTLDKIGGDCRLNINNYEVLPSVVEDNEFIFEFNGGVLTLTGNDTGIFGLNIYKEFIYDLGKCMLCLDSDTTLKLHPGDLVVEGGVIVNGNPYGISPVKFATVTKITPLIIK